MPRASAPLMLSTWSFGQRGHTLAWPALEAGGAALDAVETVCRVIDDDPEVDSVGFGGLPDRDGRLTVDGAVMLAPDRSGAVAGVAGYRHPASIARRVMEETAHVMLVGEGAERFAEEQGLTREETLSEEAHRAWERWRASPDTPPPDQARDRGYAPARPMDRGRGGRLFNEANAPDDEARWRHHDTIAVLALDTGAHLAGACSTSGMPFKVPGRVGDSPIIGSGLYVDPEAGAAVATGTGELIMGVCGAFLAVETMRRDVAPAEALRAVLERIAATHALAPEHQVGLIGLRPDGTWASAALRDGYRVSVAHADGQTVVTPDVVLLPGT